MDARLPALSAEEMSAIGGASLLVGGTGIVEEIRKALFHQHESQRDIWKDYGSSTVR